MLACHDGVVVCVVALRWLWWWWLVVVVARWARCFGAVVPLGVGFVLSVSGFRVIPRDLVGACLDD